MSAFAELNRTYTLVVICLIGPCQCGKTTLAGLFGEQHKATCFDLESIPDQRRLQHPELMLGSPGDRIILDEIQIMPELFSVLRVLVNAYFFQNK